MIRNSYNRDSILRLSKKKKKNKKRNNIKETTSKTNEDNIIKKIDNILSYNDDEVNDLPYDLALQNDKRTYCLFYFSLMRTNHSFISTFIYNKDYNSKIIKIYLFLFGFAFNYTVNGFFF